jgi:hypothetical protein
VPNGVAIGRPPANRAPPGSVWQAMQSPARARYSPLVMMVWSSACAAPVGRSKPASNMNTASVPSQKLFAPRPTHFPLVIPAHGSGLWPARGQAPAGIHVQRSIPASEPVKELKLRRTSAVGPSRRPLHGLLRMRNFLNAIKNIPHPEERLKGASRRTRRGYATNFFRRSRVGMTMEKMPRISEPVSSGGQEPIDPHSALPLLSVVRCRRRTASPACPAARVTGRPV